MAHVDFSRHTRASGATATSARIRPVPEGSNLPAEIGAAQSPHELRRSSAPSPDPLHLLIGPLWRPRLARLRDLLDGRRMTHRP